jgi:hypothetical protein
MSVASSMLVVALSLVGEDARIRAHLLRAEVQLHSATPAGLSSTQLAARAVNLRRLHQYIEAGRFPRNRDFSTRTPYFIDADGTRCAMGALIEQAGGASFVQRIARERNNARIAELADEPELHAWLSTNGLTLAEAAMVQPSYSNEQRCQAFFDRGSAYDSPPQFHAARRLLAPDRSQSIGSGFDHPCPESNAGIGLRLQQSGTRQWLTLDVAGAVRLLWDFELSIEASALRASFDGQATAFDDAVVGAKWSFAELPNWLAGAASIRGAWSKFPARTGPIVGTHWLASFEWFSVHWGLNTAAFTAPMSLAGELLVGAQLLVGARRTSGSLTFDLRAGQQQHPYLLALAGTRFAFDRFFAELSGSWQLLPSAPLERSVSLKLGWVFDGPLLWDGGNFLSG